MKKIITLCVLLLFCTSVIGANNYTSLTAGISQISLMKKYKNVNLISQGKLKKECIKFTQEDRYVIIKYVMGAVKGENTFLLTNCYLRDNLSKYLSPKDITKPLKCRLQFYADSLAKTVSKTKLPQNTILYYGAEDKEVYSMFATKGVDNIISQSVSEENLAVLKSKLLNKEFTEKGFLLTSYEKNNIKKTKFRFIINAPKNLQAVLIDEIVNQENKQVLINAGYKWKVTNIEIFSDNDKARYYTLTIKLVL